MTRQSKPRPSPASQSATELIAELDLCERNRRHAVERGLPWDVIRAYKSRIRSLTVALARLGVDPHQRP